MDEYGARVKNWEGREGEAKQRKLGEMKIQSSPDKAVQTDLILSGMFQLTENNSRGTGTSFARLRNRKRIKFNMDDDDVERKDKHHKSLYTQDQRVTACALPVIFVLIMLGCGLVMWRNQQLAESQGNNSIIDLVRESTSPHHRYFLSLSLNDVYSFPN